MYILRAKVLSDPKKKQIYDQFGEDGLKSGMGEGGGFPGGGFHSGGNFRNAEDLFRDLFGGGGGGFGGGGSSFTFSSGDGFPGAGGGFGEQPGFNQFFTGNRPRTARKQPDSEYPLKIDLEDLYRGTSKKLKISRDVMNADGTMRREDKIHHVEIKAGYKAGTKIKYQGAGGERPGYEPADVVFIIEEKPHERFRRNKDNLECTETISLSDAIAGSTVKVKGIDGKTYQLDCTREIISPSTTKIISGAGMPISKRPGEKGDLIVNFAIQFPSYLNSEKKRKIRELLS